MIKTLVSAIFFSLKVILQPENTGFLKNFLHLYMGVSVRGAFSKMKKTDLF